ncbi:helix-turn-helix transcriptional regulator [Natrinema sp. 74]|uniref:helix-turn-helix transcriptional regulator n=1 Tax=Natrinema sp. 74 TaxID=3384159 RepID=UPI0038D4F89F
MNRPVSVGLVVFVILAVAAGVSGSAVLAPPDQTAPTAMGTAPEETGTATSHLEDSRFAVRGTQDFTSTVDTTTFEITVHENGSATWTIRHEQRFANDENETKARRNFKAFAEEFETNETALYDGFRNQSQLLTQAGAQESGREMEATNHHRSARIEERINPTGVVEMSFLWKNFAAVEGDRIIVGDVFKDLYIGPDQQIVIEAGGDLTFRTVEPNSEYAGASLEDTDSVSWNGAQEFVEGRPRAVFDRPGSVVGSGSEPNGTSSVAGSAPYLAGGLVIAILAAAAIVWYRRNESGPTDETDGTTEPDAASTDAGEPPSADEQPSSAAATTAAPDQNGGVADPLSEEELMTDEDRVVKLIRENGGRMKQVNIVEETGWSKSKVSMLLSDMEDDGTISKLRVGRENIISLEGFEPEATKSPFDE